MSCVPTRRTHFYEGVNKDEITFEVNEGEPVFILRAQDITARDCVLIWADFAENAGAPKDKVEDAKRIAAKFKAWRNKKVPD